MKLLTDLQRKHLKINGQMNAEQMKENGETLNEARYQVMNDLRKEARA